VPLLKPGDVVGVVDGDLDRCPRHGGSAECDIRCALCAHPCRFHFADAPPGTNYEGGQCGVDEEFLVEAADLNLAPLLKGPDVPRIDNDVCLCPGWKDPT
jgi:hypothetical protein